MDSIPDINKLQADCETIETRILSRQAQTHHVLTILRLAPADTVLEELAEYAFNLETLLSVRRAIQISLKDQNDHLRAQQQARKAA